MITNSTTLILGAGASMDFGYPSGNELFNRICDKTVEGNSNEYLILKSITKSPKMISSFNNDLLHSGRKSVDEFLQYRQEYDYIGKCAISLALIPYEIEDKLFKTKEKNENWYKFLFKKITEDCQTAKEIKKNIIKIITFNYDRSLEHFLFKSIRNSYGTSASIAAEIVKSFDILHLHGMLGYPACFNDSVQLEIDQGVYDITEGKTFENTYYRNYLPKISDHLIKNSIKDLKIIHDKQNEKLFEKAREILEGSNRVYFLGFGYNKVNMDRIGIPTIHKKVNIHGTVYGMRKKEIEQIIKDSKSRLQNYNFVDCTIENFFREHRPLD